MNKIKTVTILGANGTMGQNISAIFASFGSAKVYLVSRDIAKSEAAKNNAYHSVRAECIKERMIPADYSQLEECVLDSDLIFEACAENMSIKNDIHQQISDILKKHNLKKILCTGTSGLSVTKLAENYPDENRAAFMGMHFFNPPYQLTLCEMIPTKYTEKDSSIFEFMKAYAADVLRRTVVETPDTAAFLGNRIGFQFINEAMQQDEKYCEYGGIDYIDSILGGYSGRSMAPIVTANFVGLDVHKAIVDNIYENTNDYARSTFVCPDYINKLVDEGKTGRKAGGGVYKTVKNDDGTKQHLVYDIKSGEYRNQSRYTFDFALSMKNSLKLGDYAGAFKTLIESDSQEAKICCEMLLKYIVYSMNASKETGCPYSSADDVMATGFRWCPPIAMYEAFSAVCDFNKLCKECLTSDINEIISKNNLLENVEKSKYDYRRFILAK